MTTPVSTQTLVETTDKSIVSRVIDGVLAIGYVKNFEEVEALDMRYGALAIATAAVAYSSVKARANERAGIAPKLKFFL